MTALANPAAEPESIRAIVSTRVFAAPGAAVFAAFTDPARLAQWWGPKDFTNTFRLFDLRPGGRWEFTMQAPDGECYDNVSEFREIAAPGLIVFEHLGPMHWYRMTMTFAVETGGTRLTWRMVFASAAEIAQIGKFIVAGNEQNFDRLEVHLRLTA